MIRLDLVVLEVIPEVVTSKKDGKQYNKITIACDMANGTKGQIALSAFGPSADALMTKDLRKGTLINVDIGLSSRKSNDRWWSSFDILDLNIIGMHTSADVTPQQGRDLFKMGENSRDMVPQVDPFALPSNNPFGNPEQYEDDGLPF